VEIIAGKVKGTLLPYCEQRGFAFASRTKTLESIAEKIETGRYPRWSALDDLFACTLVIPTLLEEEDVLVFLESVFKRHHVSKRGATLKSPDVFRFESTRFIGKLMPPHNSDEETPIHKIPFEVQIRSAFEHAWSVTTHSLTYKSPVVDWRMMRLSAQLKAVVEQLDTLILGFWDSAKLITEHSWPEVEARKSVATFFQQRVESGIIPDELAPKDWSRFSDNFVQLLRAHTNRAKTSGSRWIKQVTDEALIGIDEHLGEQPPCTVPRTISLLQWAHGVLCQRSIVINSSDDHSVLLSPELLDLFPCLCGCKNKFEFDEWAT